MKNRKKKLKQLKLRFKKNNKKFIERFIKQKILSLVFKILKRWQKLIKN